MEVRFCRDKKKTGFHFTIPTGQIFGTRSKTFHTDRTLLFFLDVDECKDIAFICGLDGICINKNGSYDCVCPAGQKPNPRDKRCEGR